MNALGASLALQDLIVRNGSSLYFWQPTLTVDIANDVWFTSGVYNNEYGCTNFTLNVSGNLYWNAYRWMYSSAPGYTGYVKMTGNNKAIYTANQYGALNGTIEIAGTGIWDNNSVSKFENGHTLLVKAGASIGSNALIDGHWYARQIVLEGGQANLPAYGSKVDFHLGSLTRDNGSIMSFAGGVIYPRDLQIQASTYWYPEPLNSVYTWRPDGGDVTVARDLYYYQNNALGTFVLDMADCTSGTSRNLTVNLDIYPATGGATVRHFLLKLQDGNHKVGGSITLGWTSNYWGNQGAIDFGGSTLTVGGDFILRYPTAWVKANWNAGTSTVVCDGNGTGKTQTLHTYGNEGIALNNLTINNPGGIVRLASPNVYETAPAPNRDGGDLLLHGNLVVVAGTFQQNGQMITFNGPAHLIQDLASTAFENMTLLADAILGLGSDINMDNLTLGSNAKVYLNGFKLFADGTLYDGTANLGMQWANDQGLIIANEVPEPATLLLLGTGAVGVFGWVRRRRMA